MPIKKIERCHYFRNDDGICFCEVGNYCRGNADKSDCSKGDCAIRHNVSVLRVV